MWVARISSARGTQKGVGTGIRLPSLPGPDPRRDLIAASLAYAAESVPAPPPLHPLIRPGDAVTVAFPGAADTNPIQQSNVVSIVGPPRTPYAGMLRPLL
jgi:hypothetical protein